MQVHGKQTIFMDEAFVFDVIIIFAHILFNSRKIAEYFIEIFNSLYFW